MSQKVSGEAFAPVADLQPGAAALDYEYSAALARLALEGGNGDDNLQGGAEGDVLNGNGGNDLVVGAGGADTLTGGEGNDRLVSHVADPSHIGSLDTLAEADSLSGGAGDDILHAGFNDDVDGGTQSFSVDRLLISFLGATAGVTADFRTLPTAGSVTIGEGTITGVESVEWIEGSNFDDLLAGYSGGPFGGTGTIYGRGGNDNIILSAGIGAAYGGDGNDTIDGRARLGSIFLSGEAGDDVIYAASTGGPAEGGEGADIIHGSSQFDSLRGDGGNDQLYGGASFDQLAGGAGDDFLDGGAGSDDMSGQSGNDVYVVDALPSPGGFPTGDLVIEQAGEGSADEVRTALAAYTLPANVEILTGTSTGGQTLTGNGDANTILGGLGGDVLAGAGGNDTLEGNGGDDRLVGGSGDDSYSGGDGTDTVDFSGETGPVVVNLHAQFPYSPADHPFGTRLVGPGEALDSFGNYESLSGIENVILTAGNDRVLGSDGANRLEGGAGNDELLGEGGNDVILAGSGDDGISGGSGDDNIQGGDGFDEVFADAGADTVDGGAGDDFVFGGADNDTIGGGADADILHGEDGNDLLSGGTGDDLMRGGAGVDSFDGGEGGEGVADFLNGDRVSFFERRATQGVVADLRTGTISNDGYGNAETMSNIESLGADTAFADTLYGDDERNGLWASLGDQIHGFGGDDWLRVAAAPAVADGGAGVDRLELLSDGGFYLPDANADGNAEIAPAMTSGWLADLGAGTLRDGYGNAGTVAGVEDVTGGGFADDLRGDGANNRLDGGAGNDQLRSGAGTDMLIGGDGNDVLYFGAQLSGGDSADGGAGRDSLVLQGNYVAGLASVALAGIESISLQSGARTTWGDTAGNFYDYDLTMADSNVAAGVQLIVNGQSLRAGEDFSFDGSAETDGSYLVYAGHGVDILKGGAGNDVFYFEGQRWGAADRVDGGAGRDAVVISAGSGLNRFEFGAASFANIESISVSNRYTTDPSQKPSYELVLHNGNVTPGGTLIVNGSSLGADQTIGVDGSAVAGGSLILFGGAGTDILKGGSGNDVLSGGGARDRLTGGAGADLFQYRSPSDSLPWNGSDTILDFEGGLDKIDLHLIDADITTPGDQAFTVIGSAQFSGQAGELRIVDMGQNMWLIMADVDGDANADFTTQADFMLSITRTDSTPMIASDFIL